ncbi:unnamed protein product [Clavelina lepadiformis]|uniref:Ras-associating and dilute domain-containing protein n=2 Tax=Clavelina lepadiformis TaxID=159417 RepID=A0ABP0GE06_CLALP
MAATSNMENISNDLSPNGRVSEDIVLSPEHLVHASDPNVVLTNPAVLSHLQQLHDKATRRAQVTADDDNTERRQHLQIKVDAFNKRSQVGAFRVKLKDTTAELGYTGPMKFYYQAPGSKSESFRLMTLSDQDCVRVVLPKLRQKFAISDDQKCTMRENINGDEILLDPDDRPLELAVNSRSPVTFHLVTGGDRNTELLKTLRNESFTPEQRRKLIEKFNLTAEFEDDDVRTCDTSSPNTPRHRISLSGSSTSGSIKKGEGRMAGLPLVPMPKITGYNSITRRLSLKQAVDDRSTEKLPPFMRSQTLSNLERPVSLPVIPDSQNSNTRSGRVRNIKHKKDSTLPGRRESRSASARKLFFSLRKYRARSTSRDRKGSKGSVSSDVEDTKSPTKTTELSSDANLPGILKIFGDAVSPGANYKSVLATKHSSSKELVKIALQRYGIPKLQSKSFVLCEVVGRFNEALSKGNTKALKVKAGKNRRKAADVVTKTNEMTIAGADFIEDYVRPLNDHEKPLVLQSFWKPQEGHYRRFEIRRRSKVFKKVEKDYSTRDINNQAKRLVMQKSRTNLTNLPATDQPQTESEDSDDESKSPTFDARRPETPKATSPVKGHPKKTSYKSEQTTINKSPDTTGGVENSSKDSNMTTMTNKKDEVKSLDSPPAPYLITLQGNENNLIRTLNKNETLVGSDVTDICLEASDILRHHCVIKRRLELLFSESRNYEAVKRWCVTITSLDSEAKVTVNGQKISVKHTLQHGELIAIGKHHIFMYKDPSSDINLNNVVSFSFSKKRDQQQIEIKHPEASDLAKASASLRTTTDKEPEYLDFIKTDLPYQLSSEDRVLALIFDCVGDLTDLSPERLLAPATLLCQCIVHSCLNFHLGHKNELLLKIGSNLQSIVLNATKSVSNQEIQSSSDPGQNIQSLLPYLRPVVFWMSNALEIFEFLQKDLIPIVKKRVEEETKRKQVSPKILAEANKFVVNEQILALLEEVVMYAFQQLVYYLTKTLYSSLPALLECNPFADRSMPGLNVQHVMDIYSSAREMTQMYDVNERIVDQLFAYLFFFTNVSLFNTLMEEDSCSRYYSWEMGVRIRGNLEKLESWAIENGFMDQCTTYLENISALANLLATPKSQFLKGSWSFFRQTFPALAPAQLKHILSGYQITGSKSKPKSWTPDMQEMDEAMNEDKIMESYDNHPPLMLPVAGSKIDFRLPVNDSWFQAFVNKIKRVNDSPSEKDVPLLCETSVREQPDGRELSNREMSRSHTEQESISPSAQPPINKSETLKSVSPEVGGNDHLSHSGSSSVEAHSANKKQQSQTASAGGAGRMVSSSSCSSSSEPEGYVIRQHRSPHQQRKISDVIGNPSHAINELVESEGRRKACDEIVVLPVSSTPSHSSQVSSNKSQDGTRSPYSGSSPTVSSTHSTQAMPKEVFIVDIKKGKTGLGVGLVDGIVTSLGVPGVFVRSLIPDVSGGKHVHTKHHDVLRCWLQEGRLQLGDRILAANGVSLINMSYHEAMRTVRHAGDNVRLLVGRCGSEVAMKITSSSC